MNNKKRLLLIALMAVLAVSAVLVLTKPKTAEEYVNRGRAYYEKKEYDKAIADYSKALRIYPNLNEASEPRLYDYANAYYLRAICWEELGNYDQAFEDTIMATKINPRHEMAYYNLGQYYCMKDLFDQSIDAFEKTVEINPENADAWLFLEALYKNRNLHNDK